MKILLYCINFSPELTGIGKYTGEMATWLAAHGHAVRVVTAPPYYPDWKLGAGFRNGYAVEASVNGASLQVWRCPLWVPAQPSGIKRLLHLASFALTSLPVMLRQIVWRPDVVWVVEPALFCAPAAVVVAQLSGAEAWLHVQDFEVDAAFDLGLLRGKWLRSMVARAERWLMRRFDVVSTISQRMHQRLLDKGVVPAKAVLTVNWVDMAQFALPSVDGVAAYRRELGIADGAVVALYSGNMGGKQGLELLADVARLCLGGAASGCARAHPTYGISMPNEAEAPVKHGQTAIIFVFCGNGAGRADLVARCAGMANVRFLDLQPLERLPDLLATADIHLLPQKAEAADLVMPSKLTGMLASGRPVVASALPQTELASVLTGGTEGAELRAAIALTGDAPDTLASSVLGHCGLLVNPGDAPAFAKALQRLANDPDLRQQLGSAGRTYAETYLDRDAVLGQFLAHLSELVRSPTADAVLSREVAHGLMTFLLLVLLVGTLMPGAWRSGIESSVHAPLGLSSLAHFVLFACMAWLQMVRPMNWSATRIGLTALALALLTEGLQFFAVERHPRWVDVGIDLAGALTGLSWGNLLSFLRFTRR